MGHTDIHITVTFILTIVNTVFIIMIYNMLRKRPQ
jgi:hypothetical protein